MALGSHLLLGSDTISYDNSLSLVFFTIIEHRWMYLYKISPNTIISCLSFGNIPIFIFFTESHLDENSSASLLCVQCKDAFQNAWDLMVHAQAAHMLNIYELGVPNMVGNCHSPPMSPRDNNTPDKVRFRLTQ